MWGNGGNCETLLSARWWWMSYQESAGDLEQKKRIGGEKEVGRGIEMGGGEKVEVGRKGGREKGKGENPADSCT
jgi:hypothetical protein